MENIYSISEEGFDDLDYPQILLTRYAIFYLIFAAQLARRWE